MKNQYDAASIEVITGLEPVKKRPGMYTDTTRPNHLAQEVIETVDKRYRPRHPDRRDSACRPVMPVIDNGRGMPVDIHPQQKIPGVGYPDKLHAGGKFSNKNYQFSGGLHGVGVSVVNALEAVRARAPRRQRIHHRFQGGDVKKRKQTGTVGRKNSAPAAFLARPVLGSPIFGTAAEACLRAKAVLCPGLKVGYVEKTKEAAGGITRTVDRSCWETHETLPEKPCVNRCRAHEVDESSPAARGEAVTEDVNLMPTAQGGTVNGLRTGITGAIREFWNSQPAARLVGLAGRRLGQGWLRVVGEDGRPAVPVEAKERLSSRETAAFVSGVAKDSFSLWLTSTDVGDQLAQLAISSARAGVAKKVMRRSLPARRCR